MQNIATPRPAATVVLLRDGKSGLETLLLKRNEELKFAGGVWVFPGGGLEDTDWIDANGNAEKAARAAAVREAYEESGLSVDPDSLIQISHWTTPATAPKRFETWFFLTLAPEKPNVLIDGSEIHDHAWMLVEDALTANQSGEIGLYPPTIITLSLLRHYATATKAMAGISKRTPYKITPVIAKTDSEVNILYPGDASYPSGDLAQEGALHRSIMRDACWIYVHEADETVPRLDI